MQNKKLVLKHYPTAYVREWRGRFRIVHNENGQVRPLCALYHTPQEAWRIAASNVIIKLLEVERCDGMKMFH